MVETDGDDLRGADLIDGLARLRRYAETGEVTWETDLGAIVQMYGARVRIVDRVPGWSAHERHLYGGRWGTIERLSYIGGPRHVEIGVRLESGPLEGEARWFRPAEIAEIDR